MEKIINLFKVSEVQLIYRNKIKAIDRPKVVSATPAYEILIQFWDKNKIELVEDVYILLLNKNNSCLGVSNVSSGGIDSCIVDPRIIFATALKANSPRIILAHNHPSGSSRPSEKDIEVTSQLYTGGQILGVEMVDHLIITSKGFYSMANEGDMPVYRPSL